MCFVTSIPDGRLFRNWQLRPDLSIPDSHFGELYEIRLLGQERPRRAWFTLRRSKQWLLGGIVFWSRCGTRPCRRASFWNQFERATVRAVVPGIVTPVYADEGNTSRGRRTAGTLAAICPCNRAWHTASADYSVASGRAYRRRCAMRNFGAAIQEREQPRQADRRPFLRGRQSSVEEPHLRSGAYSSRPITWDLTSPKAPNCSR